MHPVVTAAVMAGMEVAMGARTGSRAAVARCWPAAASQNFTAPSWPPLASSGAAVEKASIDETGALTLSTALGAGSGGTGQSGYAVGDQVVLSIGTANASATIPAAVWFTRLQMGAVGGSSTAWLLPNKSTGANGVLTLASWKYKFVAYGDF